MPHAEFDRAGRIATEAKRRAEVLLKLGYSNPREEQLLGPNAVAALVGAGVLSKEQALKELRLQGYRLPKEV